MKIKFRYFIVSMLILVFVSVPVAAFSVHENSEITNLTEAISNIDLTYSSLALDSGDRPHVSFLNDSKCLIYTAYDENAEQWQFITLYNRYNGQNSNSIAIDSRDNPHICYSNEDEFIKYCRFERSVLREPEIITENGKMPSIVLDSQDNPHIIYLNTTEDGLNNLEHSWKDKNGWHHETVHTLQEQVISFDFSIGVDSRDNLHACFWGCNNCNVTYAWKDSKGWNEEVIAKVDNSDVSIALDSGDNPHICYWDVNNNDLKYSWKDTEWHSETVDWPGEVFISLSIALDSQDIPHISYIYYDQVTPASIKHAWKDAEQWHNKTVDEDIGNLEDFIGGITFYRHLTTSLALDSNDEAHIIYYSITGDYSSNEVELNYYYPVEYAIMDDMDSLTIQLREMQKCVRDMKGAFRKDKIQEAKVYLEAFIEQSEAQAEIARNILEILSSD